MRGRFEICVVSKQVHFLIPGDLRTRSGGYGYDRQIVGGLRKLGWEVLVYELDAGFPQPDVRAVDEVRAILAAIPCGCIVVVDGLALGGMPELMEKHTRRLVLVALIHHPLALETGLKRWVAQRLAWGESRALSVMHRIIVTSATTANGLSDDGIDRQRIGIVNPGTIPRTTRAFGSMNKTPTLLSVGALIPRKGHLVLLEALSHVANRVWRLKCVGALDRSPETVSAVKAQIRSLGMMDRVSLVGEVSDRALQELYRTSDVFALASLWEGYGMAFSEALSYGLPIVATTAGAIPQTVTSGAGLLAAPGDASALGRAFATVLDQEDLRKQMADAAWSAGSSLPTWQQASAVFSEELSKASCL